MHRVWQVCVGCSCFILCVWAFVLRMRPLAFLAVSSFPLLPWATHLNLVVNPFPPPCLCADPKFGEWQHWILVNAPHTDLSKGEALTAYFGSAPGKDSGKHRYCCVVYEQTDHLVCDEPRVSATRSVLNGWNNIQYICRHASFGDGRSGSFFYGLYVSLI